MTRSLEKSKTVQCSPYVGMRMPVHISLFRNKRFMLDEMTWQNTSKFAILLEYKNPCNFFHFSFHATLFLP